MKKKRFSEEQIIAILRVNEAGAKAGDLGHKYGVSEATICIRIPASSIVFSACDVPMSSCTSQRFLRMAEEPI